MKKLLLGVLIGLSSIKIKQRYDFLKYAKEHPDDPRVIEIHEKNEEAKTAFWKAVQVTKESWAQAMVELKFEDIVNSMDPEEEKANRTNFDDIVFEIRKEAENVLASLFARLVQYDVVFVSDLYELVRIDPVLNDSKYGWTELTGAHVAVVNEKYVLKLPEPKNIDLDKPHEAN